MKYIEFRKQMNDYPFFTVAMLMAMRINSPILQNQISQWTAKGYLHKLKRGFYVLNKEDRLKNFSKFFIANQLYSPSYISMETALDFYGFIPERVERIISVSPKKTQSFDNELGAFSYYSTKPCNFDHFIVQEDEFGNKYFIASPEKALVDFLYFRGRKVDFDSVEIFDLSYRFQHMENVDLDKLLCIAKSFGQKKLLKSTELLIQYIKEEWQND